MALLSSLPLVTVMRFYSLLLLIAVSAARITLFHIMPQPVAVSVLYIV